jgi:hypothetical protein
MMGPDVLTASAAAAAAGAAANALDIDSCRIILAGGWPCGEMGSRKRMSAIYTCGSLTNITTLSVLAQTTIHRDAS